MRVANGSDTRRFSLRDLALLPRLSVLIALPLIALISLLVLEGVTRYNEVRNLNAFREQAAEVDTINNLVGALQQARADAASERLGQPVLSSTESFGDLDELMEEFALTSHAQSAALGSVPSLVTQATELSSASGTSRPDAGAVQYSAAIDRLLTSMDVFAADVSNTRIARSLDAGVEALHAGEHLRLQDLEIRFSTRSGTLDTAAIGRHTAKELDALSAFRRTASAAAADRLIVAQNDPSWAATTRLRNELIDPVLPATVDLDAWIPAVEARFASVEEIIALQKEHVALTVVEVRDERNRSFRVIALTSAVASFVVLAAMVLLSRSIIRPVHRLAHAARELKAGRVVPVTPEGRDEISDVEHAFKEVDEVLQNLMAQVVNATNRFEGNDLEARIRTEQFSGRWAELGTVINNGIDALVEGERREQKATAEAAFAKTHDLETGLPDAAHFRELASERFGSPVQPGTCTVVVRPENLRNLQSVHADGGVGLAMASFGRRVRGAVPEGAIVGRLTSHEYAVAHSFDVDVAAILASAFADPLVLRGEEVSFPISIGFSLGDGSRSMSDEVSRAVIAANHAEAQSATKPVKFTQQMRQGELRRIEVREWLESSIKNAEVQPWYQPIFEVASGDLVGYEALARGWMDGVGVAPSEFVAVAEQHGLVGALGDLMMHKCLRDHPSLPGNRPSIAVNFSVSQLRNPAIVDTLAGHLHKYRVDPTSFIVEITENAVIDNDRELLKRLHQMTDLGIRIAVDDFGTGYSSLSYLSRLPLSIIKLDRSIIAPITRSDAASAVVQRTIELAKDLNHVVIAEGVEEPEQLELLRSMGCDRVQGYLTGRPAPLNELKAIRESAK